MAPTLSWSSITWNAISTGLSPHDATIQATKGVFGPIVAIALVLCAALVPIAFLSGLTGQFYRQFALTKATTLVVAGIVTLAGACAAWLLVRGGATGIMRLLQVTSAD